MNNFILTMNIEVFIHYLKTICIEGPFLMVRLNPNYCNCLLDPNNGDLLASFNT